MERIIDALPIILLGIGQLMLALVCMNHTKRIRSLEEYQDMLLKALHEALIECNRKILSNNITRLKEDESQYNQEGKHGNQG